MFLLCNIERQISEWSKWKLGACQNANSILEVELIQKFAFFSKWSVHYMDFTNRKLPPSKHGNTTMGIIGIFLMFQNKKWLIKRSWWDPLNFFPIKLWQEIFGARTLQFKGISVQCAAVLSFLSLFNVRNCFFSMAVKVPPAF